MPKGWRRVRGYLLFVIGGKEEEVAFLRGRDALVPS
jgi:hypothetical protein